MNLDDLTLGDVKKLGSLMSGDCRYQPEENHGIKIVVLDRGFVYVGRVTTGPWCIIKGAKNIRIWGTSKGLGELRNGPLSKTTLDDCGDIKAPMSSLVFMMAVSEESWATKL